MPEGRGLLKHRSFVIFNGKTVFLSHSFIIHLWLRAGEHSVVGFVWKIRGRNPIMSFARHLCENI